MRSESARFLVWLLAVASCLGGLWLTEDLTSKWLKTHGYGSIGPSVAQDSEGGVLDTLCSATENASCEEVARDPRSAWHLRIGKQEIVLPVALLGMFYFTAVLTWLGLVGTCSPSRWWAHLILVTGTAVGVGTSVRFEYIMWATELKHYCPLCVATHVLSLLLLVFAVLLWPRREATVPKARMVRDGAAWSTGDWPTFRILLATPIVALVAISGEYQWRSPTVAAERSAGAQEALTTQPVDEDALMATLTTQPADVLAKRVVETQKKLNTSDGYQKYYKKMLGNYDKYWQHSYTSWELAPAVPISLENRAFRGPANAPHTLVVYSDFECPGCKKFEEYINKRLLPLSERRGGLVRIVFKYWPICKECNANVIVDRHPAACKAALAAEATRIVGGDKAFWKMYDLLWEKQDEWKGSRDFKSLARQIGLDEQAFERAMAGDEAVARVKADANEGANLGKNMANAKTEDVDFIKVDGTPAIFVDNKRIWRPHLNDALWLKILTSPVPRSGAPAPGASALPIGPVAEPGPVATRPGQ